MKTKLLIVILGSLSLLACKNTNEKNTVESSQTVTHNASTNEMVGTWKYEDMDFDFKINMDMPGLEDMIRPKLNEQIKKVMADLQIVYKTDGTFEVTGGNSNTKGDYKIENNELIHSNFANENVGMSFANANVAGDMLTLQVSGEQFWKMMESMKQTAQEMDQLKKMLTINKLTYKFKKI